MAFNSVVTNFGALSDRSCQGTVLRKVLSAIRSMKLVDLQPQDTDSVTQSGLDDRHPEALKGPEEVLGVYRYRALWRALLHAPDCDSVSTK